VFQPGICNLLGINFGKINQAYYRDQLPHSLSVRSRWSAWRPEISCPIDGPRKAQTQHHKDRGRSLVVALSYIYIAVANPDSGLCETISRSLHHQRLRGDVLSVACQIDMRISKPWRLPTGSGLGQPSFSRSTSQS